MGGSTPNIDRIATEGRWAAKRQRGLKGQVDDKRS
jgi:hypothetical protein